MSILFFLLSIGVSTLSRRGGIGRIASNEVSTQYSVLFAVTHAPFHVPSAEASSGPSARDRRDREVN